MADLHTCSCGFETRICQYDVTAEQWATFETFYRLAFDWASDHLPASDVDPSDAAEAFAHRYAGEEWDNDEPCSFPVYLRCEQAAEERAEEQRRDVERAAQRAEAKRRDAKWRADRRKAARKAASV
jgi:hypothetical protein